jgi:hypothetical protein
MEHGKRQRARDGAQQELRPTGRARLPPSRDFIRVSSVFHPWPQSLSGAILCGAFPLLVAAEVTRRILASNLVRLVTSAATVFGANPERTLRNAAVGEAPVAASSQVGVRSTASERPHLRSCCGWSFGHSRAPSLPPRSCPDEPFPQEPQLLPYRLNTVAPPGEGANLSARRLRPKGFGIAVGR